MTVVHYSENTEKNQNEEAQWGKSGENQEQFSEPSPSGVTQDDLNTELWQHMWNITSQECLLDPVLRALIGS